MNFFKKLFSSKNNSDNKESNFTGVYSEEYFKKRYTEEHLDESDGILDGCLKMIQSYFIDNKIEQKIAAPINHPENLDQVLDDGIGFHMYCKAFQLQDTQTAMFLAYSFSDFLVKAFDFKLYKDNEPEFPLRKMTLKYDKN
ncbi:MAG: hypothetical protein JKY70_03565, partial [Mucilaginibacter sp.]|nr:hypothetical protein [Mucilaginibacter sp.]